MQTIGIDRGAACGYLQEELLEFKRYLEVLNLKETSTSPSVAIRSHLKTFEQREGWFAEEEVSRHLSAALPKGNYKVNFLHVIKNCECGKRHKLYIHLCFDNRQALGTHLLRFKLAEGRDGPLENEENLYVAVVADHRSKKLYGWDNAVASQAEFEQALNEQYQDVLELSLTLLIVRD